MLQYSFDPNLAPVSKPQLAAICASRKLEPAGAKGSFKSFLECAEDNYNPMLDAELAKINKMRADCASSHEHAKNDPLASLTHDDEDASLIGDVVSKMMAGSEGAPIKTELSVIDVSARNQTGAAVSMVARTTAAPSAGGAAVSTSPAPVSVKGAASTTGAPIKTDSPEGDALANKKILSDPNTMILFVDDTVGTVTTRQPVKGSSTSAPAKLETVATLPASSASPVLVQAQSATTTLKPATAPPTTTAGPTKPAGLGDKIAAAAGIKTTAAPSDAAVTKSTTTTVVTLAPAAASSTTAAPVAAAAAAAAAKTTTAPATTTTRKPAEGTTKKPDVVAQTTGAPQRTIEVVLKKQDKDLKPETNEIAKKQEDSDAKKAIISLQLQRVQAHGSPSDMRMHQIEHERQMAIDPVGHTIKHQEYELNKQKKAAAAATGAPSTSTTTKKPQ